MRMEELAELLGTSPQEAANMLANEEVITLNLREKKAPKNRENFNIEAL
jgi:hypothetical protein